MKLVLKNNLLNQEYILDVRDAGSTFNYYRLSINLYSNMAEGEYEYTLLDDNDNELSNGLLQIGDYKQNNDVYEHKNKIVVYE